ncbi:MAG: hypothetical protein ABR505_02755 [Actinomycetota bacterium]
MSLRATVRQERNIPPSILSLSTFDKPDYVDLFTVSPIPADWSPEEWAGAGLRDAAGAAGQFVWRVVLGLRLESDRSSNHIAGWRIDGRDHGWLRLEASSWFLTAQIVLHTADEKLSVATFIRYDRLPAALVWPRVAVAHRNAMPRLLRHAVRSRRDQHVRPTSHEVET